MRKRFFMLFASLLLVAGAAWAQVAYTVDATTGSGVGSGWAKTWTYTTSDSHPASLQLLCNANNMTAKDNLLVLYVGTYSPATYTLQVPASYRIKSYSFDFVKDGEYTDDVTLTVNGQAYKPTAEAQTVTVDGLDAMSASFTFSGANKGIKVSNFVVNIAEFSVEVTTDENNPKWYTIKNVRGNVYASYTGSGAQMALCSTVKDASCLFYFTEGSVEGTYKIHNYVTDNLCAGHSSWTAEGIDWYLNAQSTGMSISNSTDYTSTNSSWNDAGNNHVKIAYWKAEDAGSAWIIDLYEGDPAQLDALNVRCSTDDDKVFFYIKNCRSGKYVSYRNGQALAQSAAVDLGSYWYFVDASAELAEKSVEVPEGYIACRIYNAANNLAVENPSNGNFAVNSGVTYPSRIYYIHKYEKTYWGCAIYPYNETGAGWNDLQLSSVCTYTYDDAGSIWSFVEAGKTEAALMSEAATAKTNAMTSIQLNEEADYYSYSAEAVAAAKNAIKDLDVTTDLAAAVTSHIAINAALGTLQATEQTAGPVAEDYIMLKNRQYGDYLGVNGSNNLFGTTSSTMPDPALVWTVKATDTEGAYNLYNVALGQYAAGLPDKDNTTFGLKTEQSEAGKYRFDQITGSVYAALFDVVLNSTSRGYIHHTSWGGKEMVRWEKSAEASQWIVTQVYPLTIEYMLGETEIEDLKVETYVNAGEVYTIANSDEFAGKVIESVSANGTPVEAVDGAWPVTVNANTTVTVTLKEENAEEKVFTPVEGKMYALKVSDTELYLDILTMGVNEPGQSNTNNISLSASPCVIYFEAGADGKWKMKNADGKYVRQADSRDWNAVIGESAYDWTFVEAKGLVSIARADGGFVSTDNLSAGQPLYCDKSVGLEFCFMEVIDCPTAGTSQDGKYHFTSEKIEYTTLCNKLRFILTESGAFFKNGANRMSLDEFVLYGSDGEKIVLTAADVTGNNGKTYVGLFDGVNGVYGGTATWESGTEDDWFEITLPDGIELDGAFSFSFVTENTTMNAKAFRILLSYEKQIRYTFDIQAPQGQDITVTYDGEEIVAGAELGKGFDTDLFAASDISGYAWSIVVDEENYTVTLVYAEAPVVENPEAVVALINRIGGAGTDSKFKFVIDPSMNSKQETFVIGSEEGKIFIKGSTLSAVTTGIGWYLNDYAHINISWNSLNEKTVSGGAYADLSNLPLPTTTETRTSDAKYRYYLNYCTFGYSMTSWTWKRWQQEIDWMALHGINMPLQIVGLEEVWRKFLTLEENGTRKYGYTDEEAKAFVAGPAFTAWWGMNNLEGWGGTASGTKSGGTWEGAGGVQDDAWYVRQKKLAKQIVDAQRALGMQPVIPGWSGMVPSNFASQSGYATRGNGGNWAGDFVRPLLLNVNIGAEKYAEIAADYYTCLHEVMGESRYYSMDPFHEGGGAGTMEDYEALYAAMEAAKPGSQWVIQQWQWSATQRYSLTAVPAGRLIVLDLFSDGSPAFDSYSGYAPQEAVFCAIPNFGGRSGLMGRLNNVTDNYFKFKDKYSSIKGIGTAPEAIEQTPVSYDLIYQLPWMGTKPDVAEWVAQYATARYGKDNSVVKEAWELLREGPLNYGADGIQGPVEDVWAARPNLSANPASAWGKTLNSAGGTYTKARRQMLVDATYKLLSQKDALGLEAGSIYESNYLYDLVEFGGAVMADYAYDLLLGIGEAKNAGNTALYESRRDAFLALIEDVDAFKGTNLNFRLGKWTQEARDAAGEVEGATTATPDWYEYNNARTILTTWSSPNTNLNDYSYRSWQGLMKDVYLPRWKYYFDNNCTSGEYGYFEWNWAHGKEHYVGQTAVSNVALTAGQQGHTDSYTREPEGNTVEEATKMLGKYIIPVVTADGTYYAYRYLTNDLTAKVTIIGGTGSIDLTKSFGTLEGATVTGDFIEGGTATDLAAVPVKSGLTEASYTGTVTLTDGTVLTFAVVPNPEYYGVYRIKYNNYPVFIQYNQTQNLNSDGIGYKLITPSESVVAEAEGDELFAIVPCGTGYSLSAQGKYLKSPNLSGWNHLMFSDNKDEAGAYVFEETSTDVFKIKSTGSGNNYVNNYGQVFGNDASNKENLSTFTLEEVTEYAITISDGDTITTLHLPFNVVLPAGLEAYDVTAENLVVAGGKGTGVLEKVAQAGETIKAGTPVIIKGTAGTYKLTITMDNSGAKTSLENTALRGNFVKQTLTADGDMNKYLFANGAFVPVETDTEAPANSVWVETDMDFDNLGFTEVEGDFIKVDNWLLGWAHATNGIKLTDVVVSGDGELVIPTQHIVDGEAKNVVAISPDFLWGNTDVTSVTFPATLVNLGFREVVPMFEGEYYGKAGNGIVDDTATNPVTGKIEKQGMHSCFVFPDDPATGKPYVVGKDYAWKLTLDVTVDTTKNVSFNQWGSSIVSTKDNSLDVYYVGYMQIYMRKNLQNIIVKIDNADDRYTYGTPALDEQGNEIADSLLVNTHFTFELEHDGTGGYQVVVYYDNGKAKMYSISASENNKVQDFDRLYYSLPEGIHVDVKFDRLISQGLFVGCTNLHEIIVDPANPTFKSCEHGVLYDKNGYYVMRIPEGGGHVGENGRRHFEIPSKVVKLYAGSIHGVDADIVLHSNPQIGVVEGHEDDVKNVKFFLSLDDIDNAIESGETGYGGARDFVSANANTYQSAHYRRAPLEEGKYGTIILPFVPTNAMDKYDFFELTDADNTSFHFSPVDELEPQTPYLYKLKDNPGDMEMEDGLDVFETTAPFTVAYHDKYDPNDEQPGMFRALGAYVNHYIETVNYPKSSYYYYSISQAKFLKVTKKLTYRPYRALFVVTAEDENQAAQAPARLSLRITGNDGSTTEIAPEQVEGLVEPIYYDLMGRQVENPTNGVYIVKGKKVVIK